MIAFPEEEQSHDLRDAPFSSHTELQRSELETIDEDDEPLSMERTAVLTGSSSFSRGQFQFDFECTTSHKRDISEHTLIYEGEHEKTILRFILNQTEYI